jgi:hypothetical protein
MIDMSSNQLIFRKRVIYTGLQPYLCDTNLMEALILWENHYADQPKYSLRYYVSELAKSFELPVDQKHLFLNLVATMAKPDSELLPDPTTTLQAYKTNSTFNVNYTLAEVDAFKALVTKWLSLVQSSAAKDIAYFVMHDINRLKINADLKFQIGRWLEDETQIIKVAEVQVQDLRKIINLFYVGFCEYIGPSKTDALLAEAVTRLKSNGGAAFSEIFAKLL